MAVVRDKLGCQHDVSEFYSPPRVVKMARKLGMRGGVSLDLTVPASDGFVWDFSRKHCRDKTLEIIHDQKPLFLMLSPECTPYSNIQNLNMRTPQGKAKVEAARRRGDVHLRFCVTLAQTWRVEDTSCMNTPSLRRRGATPALTGWPQPLEL